MTSPEKGRRTHRRLERANIHVRENWYRDVWLFCITVVVLIGVFRSTTQSSNAVQRTKDIQQSRLVAAHDTCQLLRRLVIKATIQNHPKSLPQAMDFLHTIGLGNCTAYGKGIIKLRGDGNQ